MICGGPKPVAFVEISSVDVSPGINDKACSARANFYAQHIIMPVRATSFDPISACVEEEIKIVLTHHIRASIDESNGSLGVTIRRQCLIFPDSLCS